MMPLPLLIPMRLIPRTGKSCPLICLKVVLEFLALIFFGVAFGICFDLAIYLIFNGVFDRHRDVFVSVSIIYGVLIIFSCVASLFTVHLLSDDFKDDDYCFKKLWKLLGLDKKKTPLPSPFDEKPKQDDGDENAYLQPIVHSIKPNMTSPEKVICEETIISKIPSNVNMEDILLQKDPSKIERMIGL